VYEASSGLKLLVYEALSANNLYRTLAREEEGERDFKRRG
jgi:hypothetical protein